jgi:hypothetical protein
VTVLGDFPIFNGQPRYATELGDVMGHESKPVNESDGGDLKVIGTDGCTERFQISAQTAKCVRSRVVERQASESRAESRQQSEIRSAECGRTFVRPVKQLALDDGTQTDFPARPGPNAANDVRIPLAEIVNTSVGIEKINRHKSSRFSYSPCGARSNSPCHAPAVSSKNPGGQSPSAAS